MVSIFSATSSGMLTSNSSSSSITNSTVSSESAPSSRRVVSGRMFSEDIPSCSQISSRILAEYHSKEPHLGQVASAAGTENSMFVSAPHTAQRLGSPSGVRDEMTVPMLLVYSPPLASKIPIDEGHETKQGNSYSQKPLHRTYHDDTPCQQPGCKS